MSVFVLASSVKHSRKSRNKTAEHTNITIFNRCFKSVESLYLLKITTYALKLFIMWSLFSGGLSIYSKCFLADLFYNLVKFGL